MYEKALELVTASYRDYWLDQAFTMNACHLLAGRLRDTAFIKSNYTDTGGISAKDFAKLIDSMFPGRPEVARKIGEDLVIYLLEFLQTHSPRDL